MQVGQNGSYDLGFRVFKRKSLRPSHHNPVGQRFNHVRHDENRFVQIETLLQLVRSRSDRKFRPHRVIGVCNVPVGL